MPEASDAPFWRREGARAAEIAALSALAFTQPVLGPMGESPPTFVALGASTTQVVTFGLLVALVPALVLAALGAASSLAGPRVRAWVHLGTLGVLAALAAVFVVRSVGGGVGLRVVGAVLVGAVVVLVYGRWDPLRTFLRFASVAPVVLLVGFLFFSPVSGLVTGGGSGADAEASGGGGDHPPVVLLVFDELPTLSLMDGSGGVDGELFPNFARLADTSTWYRDATTVGTRTAVAMPGLLTGQLPDDDGTPAVASEYPESIFALLAPTHDIVSTEWVSDMCPPGECERPEPLMSPDDVTVELMASAEGGTGASVLGTLLDAGTQLWWDEVWPLAEPAELDYLVIGMDEARDLALPGLEFLEALGPSEDGTPRFDYLHAPVPHQPWLLLPSGRAYEGPHPAWGAEFTGWDDQPENRIWPEMAQARHLLQLLWSDRLLGAIMDRLEELDQWDDAVVVVTSDHGVSFTPGESLRSIRPGNQAEIAWVPLFVKAPGQSSGETVDDNVWLIDVVPTIAELVGVDLPWELDGVSVVSGGRSGDEKVLVSGDHDGMADVDGDRVRLDADGLAAILGGQPLGQGGDELRAWRFGEHGDLVGRTVEDIGVCGTSDAAVELDVPDDWAAQMAPGSDAPVLAVWLEGQVHGPGMRQVAVVVDGVVAGWSQSRETLAEHEVGVLVAEPVAEGSQGPPVLYEITDGDGCGLAEMPAPGD